MNDTARRIHDLYCELQGVESFDISAKFDMDSIGSLEFQQQVEDEFGIRFDTDFLRARTINDMVSYVEIALNAKE